MGEISDESKPQLLFRLVGVTQKLNRKYFEEKGRPLGNPPEKKNGTKKKLDKQVDY